MKERLKASYDRRNQFFTDRFACSRAHAWRPDISIDVIDARACAPTLCAKVVGETQFLVTSGYGFGPVPFRLGTRSEIWMTTLTPSGAVAEPSS